MATRPWLPRDITSATLAGWFDAQDASTFTVDGSGKVSEWRSKVGNWSVVQASSTAQPTRSATGYNNLPAVLFTTTDHNLRGTSPSTFPTGSAAGVMSGVAPYLQRRGDYTTLCYQGDASELRARSMSAAGEWVSSGYYNNDVNSTTKWTGFDRMFISAISTSGFAEIWVDGGAVYSSQKRALTTPTNAPFYIGRSPNGDAWQSPVQEILWITGTLSSAERDKLFGYYAWRWNLVSQLPSGHAYKSAAPTIDDGTTPAPRGATCRILWF